jgi:hypothetical protein
LSYDTTTTNANTNATTTTAATDLATVTATLESTGKVAAIVIACIERKPEGLSVGDEG